VAAVGGCQRCFPALQGPQSAQDAAPGLPAAVLLRLRQPLRRLRSRLRPRPPAAGAGGLQTPAHVSAALRFGLVGSREGAGGSLRLRVPSPLWVQRGVQGPPFPALGGVGPSLPGSPCLVFVPPSSPDHRQGSRTPRSAGGLWVWTSPGVGTGDPRAPAAAAEGVSAGCPEAVYLLAVSADRHWLAAVGGDWVIHVYNLKCLKVGAGARGCCRKDPAALLP